MLIFFIFIFSLFSDTYTDHLSKLAGFETSIIKAREELSLQEEKLKNAKTRKERKIHRNDIKVTKNNIDFYLKQIKEIEKHIMLEHTEAEKDRFKTRYDRNKRKEKVN